MSAHAARFARSTRSRSASGPHRCGEYNCITTITDSFGTISTSGSGRLWERLTGVLVANSEAQLAKEVYRQHPSATQLSRRKLIVGSV